MFLHQRVVMSSSYYTFPLSGKLCNSALKNLIFKTHDTLWIVNEKTIFLIWSCDLNFHTEL